MNAFSDFVSVSGKVHLLFCGRIKQHISNCQSHCKRPCKKNRNGEGAFLGATSGHCLTNTKGRCKDEKQWHGQREFTAICYRAWHVGPEQPRCRVTITSNCAGHRLFRQAVPSLKAIELHVEPRVEKCPARVVYSACRCPVLELWHIRLNVSLQKH